MDATDVRRDLHTWQLSRVEAAATEWDLYVARRTARHSSRSARTKIRDLLPLDTDRRLNHCLADFPRLGLIEAF